jgi:hypothetical protein
MSMETFSAGETTISREQFSPSPVLFWLKTELSVTEKRITGRQPNTFAGVVPLGSSEILFPLKQVSSISVDSRVKPLRMLIGAVLFVAGLATFGSSFLGALVLIVLGAVLFVGGLRVALVVTNTAGVTSDVCVTMFEKVRLEAFASQAKAHLLDL